MEIQHVGVADLRAEESDLAPLEVHVAPAQPGELALPRSGVDRCDHERAEALRAVLDQERDLLLAEVAPGLARLLQLLEAGDRVGREVAVEDGFVEDP